MDDGPVFLLHDYLLHNEAVLSLRLVEFLRKLPLKSLRQDWRVRFYVQQFISLPWFPVNRGVFLNKNLHTFDFSLCFSGFPFPMSSLSTMQVTDLILLPSSGMQYFPNLLISFGVSICTKATQSVMQASGVSYFSRELPSSSFGKR